MNKQSYDVMTEIYHFDPDRKFPASVTAYHITPRRNVASILEHGLRASECQATYCGDFRSPAVYMLGYKPDAYDNSIRAALFGSETDLVVLKINIPASGYDNLACDGIFSASISCQDGSMPTAIKYNDDVPAEWITTCER